MLEDPKAKHLIQIRCEKGMNRGAITLTYICNWRRSPLELTSDLGHEKAILPKAAAWSTDAPISQSSKAH